MIALSDGKLSANYRQTIKNFYSQLGGGALREGE
jgi:hypothetical protein